MLPCGCSEGLCYLVVVVRVYDARQAEVGDLERQVVVVDEQVAWLQVSVQHVG